MRDPSFLVTVAFIVIVGLALWALLFEEPPELALRMPSRWRRTLTTLARASAWLWHAPEHAATWLRQRSPLFARAERWWRRYGTVATIAFFVIEAVVGGWLPMAGWAVTGHHVSAWGWASPALWFVGKVVATMGWRRIFPL